jgi:deoxyribodipyrimidine photo-lyase
MPTALVMFTRDLRLHDQPALVSALQQADAIVPAFVFDDAILGSRYNRPNRTAFLLDSLTDLQSSLREQRLRADRRELTLTPGVTVVPPGAIQPSGGDHFKVFTPYYRQWLAAPLRALQKAPRRIPVPRNLDVGRLPELAELVDGAGSPDRPRGGETGARAALNAWSRSGLKVYGDRHDDLAADGTSHVSAHLHFGSVSPLEVVTKLRARDGAQPFVRQICWRDFYHQILAARPDAAWHDYRRGRFSWADDDDAFSAWADGRTGFPVVDAAMRQLRAEGFVHNRARLITASFLTKDLALDWRLGARHFLDWLVDGDIANNNLNWQWVAGTGTDTNPHRIFNPTVQGRRFDPDGAYVRRYVPELATVAGGAVHEPWKLPEAMRSELDYPAPIVDHRDAIAAYRDRRAEDAR